MKDSKQPNKNIANVFHYLRNAVEKVWPSIMIN